MFYEAIIYKIWTNPSGTNTYPAPMQKAGPYTRNASRVQLNTQIRVSLEQIQKYRNKDILLLLKSYMTLLWIS